ncbi:hypothetical protein L2E82_12737 [Cichorium intybus]|uniref:Uncharacterized protein n=1 Tax=Cichorium intybus TaxID=13427 RepID=A0ACB9GHN2_CICIN|nr:hypothetical protein L2E82_12737 [Cichorium intybus]
MVLWFGHDLEAKEFEFKKLSSIYEESWVKFGDLDSEIEGLKQETKKLEKKLGSKSFNVDELNDDIQSLYGVKNVSSEELESVKREFNEVNLYAKHKAPSDARLLEETGKKLEDFIVASSASLLLRHRPPSPPVPHPSPTAPPPAFAFYRLVEIINELGLGHTMIQPNSDTSMDYLY